MTQGNNHMAGRNGHITETNDQWVEEPNKLQTEINWYLSLIVLILFIVVPPILCGLFYLSRVPDITWASDDNLTYTRVWMYRERRPLGLAFETRQLVERYTDTRVCVQNKLRFFLWGESDIAKPATSRHTMEFYDNRWHLVGEECQGAISN